MNTPGFRTALDLREADENQDDGKWMVCAPLIYASRYTAPPLATLRSFEVPVGFQTDLASVPRLPVVYLLCGGRATKPAVLHDYLYSTGLVPREIADAIFREAMKSVCVPAAYRWLMWAGVRVGGASHYTASKPDEVSSDAKETAAT
jgi:hypothetical protein